MLDSKYLRTNPEEAAKRLATLNFKLDTEKLSKLDSERKEAMTMTQELQARRNSLSKEIGKTLKSGGDASALKAEVAKIGDELAEVMNCITKIENDIKNNGMSCASVSRCKQLVFKNMMSGNDRQRKLGTFIIDYLDREISFMDNDDNHNASSDVIESTFGVLKARKSDDKLVGVTPIILMMPLRIALANRERRDKFDYKKRLEDGRYRHIKEWTDVHLSPNLVVKRNDIIGKNCVGF